MPRVKLGVPQVDALKGLILERQNALGISDNAMSKKLGVATGTYNSMIHKPTDQWKLAHIKKACTILGIPKDDMRACI